MSATATMPTPLREQGEKLRTKLDELNGWFKKKGADGTLDVTAAERDTIKSLNSEVEGLHTAFQAAKDDWIAETRTNDRLAQLKSIELNGLFDAAGGDGPGTDRRGHVKDLGELFADSDAYKSFSVGRQARRGKGKPEIEAELDVSLKTLFQRSAGWDPFVARQPGFVASAQQMPGLIDLLPTSNTDQTALKWMLETLYTNNAAPTAEAVLYPESAFRLTEQTTSVQKIAHFIPVTDEQIADVAGVRDYLNSRMELGLKQALEIQVVRGNGTAPQLQGLFNTPGAQSQAQGSDVLADAFYKAMVKIQTVAFGNPDTIWMNPTDWMAVRLFKTSQGLYLWGNPDQVGITKMWGLNVATSTFITLGNGLVMDAKQFVCLFMRAGVNVHVSDSHADFFQRGQLALRSEVRAALQVTRPTALCTVGINANGLPTT